MNANERESNHQDEELTLPVFVFPPLPPKPVSLELWQQLNEQLVKELKQPDQYDHLQQSPAHTPVPVPFRL